MSIDLISLSCCQLRFPLPSVMRCHRVAVCCHYIHELSHLGIKCQISLSYVMQFDIVVVLFLASMHTIPASAASLRCLMEFDIIGLPLHHSKLRFPLPNQYVLWFELKLLNSIVPSLLYSTYQTICFVIDVLDFKYYTHNKLTKKLTI